jgi:hypothetical protein
MNEKNVNLWMMLAGAFVVGLLAGGGVIFAVKGASAVGVDLYPSKAAGDWIVKIDDYTVGKAEFDEGYKMFMDQIPAAQKMNLPPENEIKAQYVESLIGQYALLVKLLNERWVQTKEGKLLLRQALYQIYLQKEAAKNQEAFVPSKPQIDRFYQQYKSQFDKSGLGAEQIRQQIVQTLGQQNMQVWALQYVKEIRENYKIQRNTTLMEKEGISAAPSPQLGGSGMTLPQATPKQ